MENKFDEEYVRVCNNILQNGFMKLNERTGKSCLTIHGEMMKFDFSVAPNLGKFPLLTLRKMYPKGIIAELLGFIRGYDNAADFRKLECNLWNANANETEGWLKNPHRKGKDDLGRIYGVQARGWKGSEIPDIDENGESCWWPPVGYPNHTYFDTIDQLRICVDKIKNNIDDRRLIVIHWNPGELDQMALAPCHMCYQFHIREKYLDMNMFQRSADGMLGIPSNISSYALLLTLVAKITNKEIGAFTHFLGDTHLYEDHIDLAKTLVVREPFLPPKLWINPEIKTLEDLESWVTVDDIKIQNYEHNEAIDFPFSA